MDSFAASPLVTIVIPCRNEAESIAACLDSVSNQTVTDTEILVVDGGSTDGTREIVKDLAGRDDRIKLLDNPRGIVPSALNVALDEAKGHWLVRVDAHCTISEDYVQRLVALLETGVGGAGGRKQGVGKTITGKAIALAMSSKAGVGGSAYHHARTVQLVDHIPFGAYPVELARGIGGWDENLSVNQDFEFDQRIRAEGHDLILDPSIVIDWENRQTFEALARQYRRYGRGKTRVMRLHPQSVKVRHLVAPAFVAALTVGAVPWPGRMLWAARGLLAGSYGAVVSAAAWSSGGGLPVRHRWRVAASLAIMHLAWGVGFWQGVYDMLSGQDDRAIVDADRLRPVERCRLAETAREHVEAERAVVDGHPLVEDVG